MSDNPPGHPQSAIRNPTAFELLRALEGQPSCPVCHLTREAVANQLDAFAYESVTDPATRKRLRDALGYCAAHGQLWLAQYDTLATAIIYDDVFTQVLAVLQAHLDANDGDNERTPGD